MTRGETLRGSRVPQQSLFGYPPDLIKQDNDTIAEAFRERLRTVAGFAYVPEPLQMKNSNNAVVYYLFLASPKAKRIIEDIFAKYRGVGAPKPLMTQRAEH